MLEARNESGTVEWSAMVSISGETRLEETDRVVEILERFGGSLIKVGAEVRMLMLIDGEGVTIEGLKK